jgi:hypothetical protein
MLYDKFKPLVVNGPGWSFVKKFDNKKQGRKAVLVLKTQAEGTSAEISHKAAVYTSIMSSSYHGPRKGFTFSSYVTLLHQAAHNKLLDLDEPVSETKKVAGTIVHLVRGLVIHVSHLVPSQTGRRQQDVTDSGYPSR